MSLLTFKINGTEFIDCIAERGIKWAKNDLDDNAERTQDGVMHRNKITEKRKLDIQLDILTNARMKALTTALNYETVSITFYDPILGEVVKEFYSTNISCAVSYEYNGVLYWDSGSFSLTEV